MGMQANDVGEGWLIFPVSDAEVAVHPVEDEQAAPAGPTIFVFWRRRESDGRRSEISAPVCRLRPPIASQRRRRRRLLCKEYSNDPDVMAQVYPRYLGCVPQ